MTADAYTVSTSPGQNNGSASTLFVRNVGAGGVRITFARFDVESLSGAPIAKAVLRLWVSDVQNTGSLEVHRVNTAWGEATLTAGTAPALGPTAATAAVATTDVNHFLTVDVTGLVSDWMSGAQPNHGLALTGSAADDVRVELDSKENGVSSHAMELEVTRAADITSVLTLPGSGLAGGGVGGDVTLSLRNCATNQLLRRAANGNWVCADYNSGTVTQVNAGLGLVGGPITSNGTLGLDTAFTDSRYVRQANGGLTVDCTGSPLPGSFATLPDALLAAQAYSGRVTIVVRGNCSVTSTVHIGITGRELVLEGAGPGDGFTRTGPAGNAPLLRVSGANVLINNLVLQGDGSGRGLVFENGARFEECIGLSIQGFRVGVDVVAGSRGAIIGSVIQAENSGYGATVGDGGVLSLVDSQIRGGGVGVSVNEGSLSLSGPTVIEQNGTGVIATFGSRVRLDGSIRSNTWRGVDVQGGSIVTLGSTTLVRSNGEDGIHLADTSLLVPQSPGAQVTGNTGWGIRCDPAPAVAQIAAGVLNVNVSGNLGGQIACPQN